MLSRIASRRSQAGIGLLELMLSIAIISLLLIMATRYYQSARLSQQVTNAASIVQGVRAAAGSYTAGQPNYATVSMPALITAGLIPNDIAGPDNNGTGTNPWGGSVEANPNTNPSNVDVVLTNVPAAACQSLITLFANQAVSTNPGSAETCGTTGAVTVTFTFS